MENRRVIVYGLGKRFNMLFMQDGFMNKVLNNLSYTIIGISDRDSDNAEKYSQLTKYKFISADDINTGDADFIVVTSSAYFQEIKQNLVLKGIGENSILSASELIFDYFELDDWNVKKGIEVGGPSSIFEPIYDKCVSCDDVNFNSNTVWWVEDKTEGYYYRGKKIGKIFIADATDLSCIESNKYDFLLSSNNLEHIANPIKALREFTRIVRAKGVVIVAVPNKEKTFDHNREYTSFEHILNDYSKNIGEDDLSHLKEILDNHDYSMDSNCGGKENFIKRAERNYENRCLHQHVFCEESLKKMFQYAGLNVNIFEKVGSNYVIVGEKC